MRTQRAGGLRHIDRTNLFFGIGPKKCTCITGPHEFTGAAMHRRNTVSLAHQKPQAKGVAGRAQQQLPGVDGGGNGRA